MSTFMLILIFTEVNSFQKYKKENINCLTDSLVAELNKGPVQDAV